MSRRPRLRHHVNPLNVRELLAVPDWGSLLARPELPKEVDLGCGHGAFLLERARQRPDLNLVGLEVRKNMAQRVQARIERLEVSNATVLWANANLNLCRLFPQSSLQRVYVHFPDPWFKKRHRKRRVVTPALVKALAQVLAPGGSLRFMSDVEEYAQEVAAQLAGASAFENPFGPGAPAPQDPELPLTHREAWHSEQGDPVYRYLWRRRA